LGSAAAGVPPVYLLEESSFAHSPRTFVFLLAAPPGLDYGDTEEPQAAAGVASTLSSGSGSGSGSFSLQRSQSGRGDKGGSFRSTGDSTGQQQRRATAKGASSDG
jgi:hypothetical protein